MVLVVVETSIKPTSEEEVHFKSRRSDSLLIFAEINQIADKFV